MKKIIALACLVISTHISAEENKFYGGVEAGFGFVDLQASDDAAYLSSLLGGQTVTYSEDSGAAAGRLFIGYQFDKSMAWELGYFQTADASSSFSTAGGAGTGSATYNANAYGVDLALVFQQDGTGLFGKIGGHYSKVEQDAALTFAGQSVSLSALAWQDDWGTGFLAGAGYDYDLNDDVQIRGAYSYYDSLGGLTDADMHLVTIGIKF